MREHGTSGRAFAGRVLQVITGSSGLDDFEWGVTLFAEHPDDLKAVVYQLRFDRASAIYGDFGRFYAGHGHARRGAPRPHVTCGASSAPTRFARTIEQAPIGSPSAAPRTSRSWT